MKFLKQAEPSGYLMVKLSKYDLLRLLFTEDSFKMKEDLELVSRPHLI